MRDPADDRGPRLRARPEQCPPSAASVVALGVVGGWLALLVEVVWTLGIRGERITSSWELGVGLRSMGPAWLIIAGLFGAGGGLGAVRLTRSSRADLEWAAFFALFGALVGFGVGGGRHLSELWLRVAFAVVVGLVCGLVAAFWVRRLQSQGRKGQGPLSWATAPQSALFLVLSLIGLAVANHTVLIRLYPAFHLGLSALTHGGAGLLVALGARGGRKTSLLVFAALTLSALALEPASLSGQRLDNFRTAASDGSPTLRLGVLLAQRFVPADRVEPFVPSGPLGAPQRSRTGLDFRGRSLLLITIDALRADHVGAYGEKRPTTPEIDALAANGHVFEFAYAATPHTSYSLTSLMTGKYMRPLLLQGAGEDSELLPSILQGYGYRTAAFYPPAVFFVDADRFAAFSKARFGYEYAWVEFAEGERRVQQVRAYLDEQAPEQPILLWVHLFGPHEPYVKGAVDFGDRDVDRYDSEIREADRTVGALTRLMRARDPKSIVVISADHGEEFGEHGGRYHGTTVYEEQVRVPMIWHGEGIRDGRSRLPVQTVDVVPTVLSALRIPIPPRVRGNDLTSLLGARSSQGEGQTLGFAASETDTMTLYAEGSERLVCARDTGSCQLFDLSVDPRQVKDLGPERRDRLEQLRSQSRAFAASHGAFETRGLREGGRDLPQALVRGLAGDREVAPQVGQLLDDADFVIRRKAAELLFAIGSEKSLPALRLAFAREEDSSVRRALALALTRFGEPVALADECLVSPDLAERRRAALAFAVSGDLRGLEALLHWFSEGASEDEARLLIDVFARAHVKKAVPVLVGRLDDVRLRPLIAEALARIGEKTARPALLAALMGERYVSTRPALFGALKSLGAKDELVSPLRLFLGMPDPLPNGLSLALELGLIDSIGGPNKATLARLRTLSDSGVGVDLSIPPQGSNSENSSVRLLVLGRGLRDSAGHIRVERASVMGGERKYRVRPKRSDTEGVEADVPAGPEPIQLDLGVFPALKPGRTVSLNVFSSDAEVLALAALPMRQELPPPPPAPVDEQSGVEKTSP